jgi:hypothetical protein
MWSEVFVRMVRWVRPDRRVSIRARSNVGVLDAKRLRRTYPLCVKAQGIFLFGFLLCFDTIKNVTDIF